MQVLAASASMIVQDCVEAEENVDARDKFFMYLVVSHSRSDKICVLWIFDVRVAVPEFDPSKLKDSYFHAR